MQFPFPSPLPPSPVYTPPSFLFRKQQTSQEYQPNMAYNVEIKLDITFPVRLH